MAYRILLELMGSLVDERGILCPQHSDEAAIARAEIFVATGPQCPTEPTGPCTHIRVTLMRDDVPIRQWGEGPTRFVLTRN